MFRFANFRMTLNELLEIYK